ncbi:tetratricopeptide repeat protein [Flavobacterium silvaticum]|uniref:Tetratricopeptide repeat protein n=1 Tax=Flavobacterium silvaticum TaxID=1852020 RepID=A0A972FN23_9FLAO|nr:tetratricopeptide repeat protein [Flavobacterium silvaticum]NMH29056.1 tetratricopeptide repeat protein [Flavobacterium silvaticum]
MKKTIITAALLMSLISFAQKDELKALKKIYDKDAPSVKDIASFKENLTKAEPLATDEGDKLYVAYYKAYAPLLDASLPENQKNPTAFFSKFSPDAIYSIAKSGDDVVQYEKKTGKKLLSDDILEQDPQMSTMLLNYAVALGEQKKEKDAAKVLYALYLMDKTKTDYLYYAASYSVNGQDFDKAMEYYNELKKINYTGEKTIYTAKSKINDKQEPFNTKAERDQAVKIGTHTLPKEEKEPSKKGEIYKNIALILVQQGKEKEAFEAVAEARRENPDDSGIMLTQADLYLKQKDIENYKKIVGEILAKDPNNADLIYNLGVVAMQGNQDAAAEEYFRKAIAIKPDYANAYINLTAVRMKPDKDIVEKMNKLGTSAADTKKYDQYKAQREKMFRDLLPDLEKAHELMPENETITQNLISVYGFLEMTDKRNALKASLKK